MIKPPKIKLAAVVRYPVVGIVFDDGVEGEIDHSENVAIGKIFERLRDRDCFNRVSVGDHGHCYGWVLDNYGEEIDFGADGTRATIESQIVAKMASRCRLHRTAAE